MNGDRKVMLTMDLWRLIEDVNLTQKLFLENDNNNNLDSLEIVRSMIKLLDNGLLTLGQVASWRFPVGGLITNKIVWISAKVKAMIILRLRIDERLYSWTFSKAIALQLFVAASSHEPLRQHY